MKDLYPSVPLIPFSSGMFHLQTERALALCEMWSGCTCKMCTMANEWHLLEKSTRTSCLLEAFFWLAPWEGGQSLLSWAKRYAIFLISFCIYVFFSIFECSNAFFSLVDLYLWKIWCLLNNHILASHPHFICYRYLLPCKFDVSINQAI